MAKIILFPTHEGYCRTCAYSSGNGTCNNKKYNEHQYEVKVVKAMYMTKEAASVPELSKRFGVSKVTIYDDIKAAEERLSALFFGINGLKFSS